MINSLSTIECLSINLESFKAYFYLSTSIFFSFPFLFFMPSLHPDPRESRILHNDEHLSDSLDENMSCEDRSCTVTPQVSDEGSLKSKKRKIQSDVETEG